MRITDLTLANEFCRQKIIPSANIHTSIPQANFSLDFTKTQVVQKEQISIEEYLKEFLWEQF